MLMPGQHLSWKDFARKLKDEYTADNLGDVAGAVTFFALLSLFPFLLFAVALAGLIMAPQQAGQLVQQLGQVAPPEVTKILGDRLQEVAASGSGGLLSVGALIALWTTTTGVTSLMRAFNTAYGVEESRGVIKQRLIAVLAVVLSAVVMLAAGAIMVALPALGGFLEDWFGAAGATAIRWLRFPVAGVLVMLLWAVLYVVLPNAQQRFRFITFGSVVGVVIWLLASAGFSLYVSHLGKFATTYGALGGVIVLLLWMWITAQALLLGAEMNAILEHTSPEGKRAGAKRLEDSGKSGTKGEERPGDRLPRPTSPRGPPPAAPRRPDHLH